MARDMPWLFRTGRRRAAVDLERAQAALSESTDRLAETCDLTGRAAILGGRLRHHREENHFAARLETLFKETR